MNNESKTTLKELQLSTEVIYKITYTHKFKKDVKRCKKRGLDLQILRNAVDILSKTGQLPPEYKAHPLFGIYKNKMECHLRPDWLLIWMQKDDELVLLFTDTGTHADLFGM